MERVRRGKNKKDKGKNVSIEAGEACKKDKRKNVGIKAGEGTGQGVDYISYLPEVILLHILSFLPLKDLIVVSLISKQWKYLWTKISSLNLDDTEFTRNITLKDPPCPSCGAPNSRHDRSQCQSNSIYSARKKFAEVVDRTFLLHTGCTMKNLRLSLVYDDDQNIYANRIDTWVHFAFTTNVKELELNFNFKGVFEIYNELGSAIWRRDSKEPYDLPHNYFAPKVLETLTLTFWKFKATSFRVLSSLRKLYLKHTELLICSIGELASPCPVLEDLILESCRIPNGFLVSEGDIMIKRISLIECVLDDMFRIDLSAPNLLMLTIAGAWLRSASIRKASHLTNAAIKFRKVFADHEQGDALLSLLAGLNNCEFLRLATVAVEVVPREVLLPQQLRMDLQNLKKLELFVGITKQELRRICCLLRSSPKLENLILVLHGPWLVDIESLIPGMPEFDAETYLELESKNSPFPCLQNTLKVITIQGLVGRSIEVQATLFLLKHATLLENLTIAFAEEMVAMMIHPRYYRELRKNSHKLLDFIKTSTRAQVEILGDPIQRTI